MLVLYTACVHSINGFLKYRNINNIDKFIKFLDKKHEGWTAANFYYKETRKFYKQIKRY